MTSIGTLLKAFSKSVLFYCAFDTTLPTHFSASNIREQTEI